MDGFHHANHHVSTGTSQILVVWRQESLKCQGAICVARCLTMKHLQENVAGFPSRKMRIKSAIYKYHGGILIKTPHKTNVAMPVKNPCRTMAQQTAQPEKRTKSSAIRHTPPVNTVGQHVIAPSRHYHGDSRSSTSRHFFGKRQQNKRINLWKPPRRTHAQSDMLLYQRHMAVRNSSHQHESATR